MGFKYKLQSKIESLSRRLAIRANCILGNYGEVVWLVGDGRSGTTWVSDLINYDRRYREMFEPFHPKLVREVSFMLPHQYVRACDSHEKLEGFVADVFSGKFVNERVDSGNGRYVYNGLLVKDVFANLLCYWAVIRNPKVKPVLLIRNPFSVAISKYKKKSWYWAAEPLELLQQADLREDYLLPFEDLIRKTSSRKDFILNQVLVWSVINYVPLQQFRAGGLCVCFYEDIYEKPSEEVSRILEFVRGSSVPGLAISEEVAGRPSRMVGTESNVLAGTSPVSSWKNELGSQLIDSGMEILGHFGFGDLYGHGFMPNKSVIQKVCRSE